jgi:hypothetical protein
VSHHTNMSQQIKDLMRKYGKVAVGVHLGVYATTFAGEEQRHACMQRAARIRSFTDDLDPVCQTLVSAAPEAVRMHVLGFPTRRVH